MSEGSDESGMTVALAGGANLLIAAAKLVAGIVSGSSAMLSEAAHSFADTLNQVFLMTALRRSQKPADQEHPFGYGMERYFWSLLAAVGIFVLGAGFAAYQGISALVSEPSTGNPMWSFIVLGVSFLFEGTSFARAFWQLRKEARQEDDGVADHLLHHAEPALRAVVAEDGVALIGLVLAAVGLALVEVTGSHAWDGVASLAIAALLIGIAYNLASQNKQYLIGKAVSPELADSIAEEITKSEQVDGLVDLMTMRLAPDQVLVAAHVDLAQGPSSDEFEAAADDIEARSRDRFPEVRHVFLDPTPGHADEHRSESE
jgi:cation diffusion facilitator family transporter